MTLQNAIRMAIATSHLPSMAPALIGPVGIGKTSMIIEHARRLAARQGRQAAVITFHASQVSSTEVLGLPHFEKQTLSDQSTRIITTWSVPGIIHAVNDAHEKGLMPFLSLDELFQGDAATIKALRQLIGERRLGQHALPPGTRVIVASNRTKDRAGVGPIATHMINVLMLLNVRWNIKTDWLPWANTQDFLPIFVDWMINQSHEFLSDEVPKDPNTPFPTVRSLTLAERVLRTLGVDNLDDGSPLPAEIIEAISGLIDVAAATSLASRVRLREFLPSIDDIIKDPETATLPANRPDIHSILTHLIPQAVPNEDELVAEDPFAFGASIDGGSITHAHTSKIEAALAYTDRLPAEFRPAVWEAILRRTKGRACTVPAMRTILEQKGKAFLSAALNAL